MSRNKVQWGEDEQMRVDAYANIASSFSQITAYMKNHLRTVQDGGGVITEGDFEDIFKLLSDMINKNLHNATQMRVKISTDNIDQKEKSTAKDVNFIQMFIKPMQAKSKQQRSKDLEPEFKRIFDGFIKKMKTM